MIEQEKITELKEAFDVLVKHNLYRRGAINYETAENTPGELGEAIDLAAGTILEYLALLEKANRYKAAKEIYSKNMQEYQAQWNNAEKSVKTLTHLLGKERNETKRLQALLASHHIKYSKAKDDEKSI